MLRTGNCPDFRRLPDQTDLVWTEEGQTEHERFRSSDETLTCPSVVGPTKLGDKMKKYKRLFNM